MDKQRLQQLAGIVTEGVSKCSCGCEKDKCKCKPDCDCGCNKKVDEMAGAFGEDGNDGSGGGASIEGEEMAYEDEESRQAFQQALEVIAKEIVKAIPHPPEGQKIDTEEAIDGVMQGRWREMLKDEIRDILEPGPSHNPDGMSRTEPHITF